jgi:putative tricarboxylic transport membrane protein
MKKYSIIPALVWVGLSLFVMIFSYRMGLGGFHNPGPGLMPFLLGLFLFPISLYLLITSVLRKEEGVEAPQEGGGQTNYRQMGLILISLFVYAFLLEKLGFLITTFIFLVLLFRSVGNRWITVLAASVSTVLAAYFVFTFFGVRFPEGILRLGG